MRIHDLPFMVHNKITGERVGNSLGEAEEVGEMKWGEYIRVRIKMDIIKPLVRKKKLIIGGIELVWIRFSYERLLDFCLYCSVIDHNHKDCTHWKDQKLSETKCALPYGNELRANQRGGRGPYVPPKTMNPTCAARCIPHRKHAKQASKFEQTAHNDNQWEIEVEDRENRGDMDIEVRDGMAVRVKNHTKCNTSSSNLCIHL